MCWRKINVLTVCVLASALVVVFGSVSYSAVVVEFEKPCELYGHVWNEGGICGAAATINSFVYLQNKYPGVYDHKLVKDYNGDQVVDVYDWEEARDELAYGWDGRTGMYGVNNPIAATARTIWEHKVYWIEDHAPGSTIFHGQINTDTTNWYYSDAIQGGMYPEWGFLWDELWACEDIELGIRPCTGSGDGHVVTLTGLSFSDNDEDGVWSVGDTPYALKYLDPNAPDECIWADIIECPLEPGALAFTWWQANEPYYVDFAYAESPIPEPATIIVWGLLGMLAAGFAYRRQRRTA